TRIKEIIDDPDQNEREKAQKLMSILDNESYNQLTKNTQHNVKHLLKNPAIYNELTAHVAINKILGEESLSEIEKEITEILNSKGGYNEKRLEEIGKLLKGRKVNLNIMREISKLEEHVIEKEKKAPEIIFTKKTIKQPQTKLKPTPKLKITKPRLGAIKINIGEARTNLEKNAKAIFDQKISDKEKLDEIIASFDAEDLETFNLDYKEKIAQIFENAKGELPGPITKEKQRTLEEINHIYNDLIQLIKNKEQDIESRSEAAHGKPSKQVKYETIPIDLQSELAKKINPFLIKTAEEKIINELKKHETPENEEPTIGGVAGNIPGSKADKLAVSTQRGVYFPNKPFTGARNLSLYQIKGGKDDVKMTAKEQKDTTDFYKEFVLVMPGFGNGNQPEYLGKLQTPDNSLLETIKKNEQVRYGGKLYQPAEITKYVFPVSSDPRRK